MASTRFSYPGILPQSSGGPARAPATQETILVVAPGSIFSTRISCCQLSPLPRRARIPQEEALDPPAGGPAAAQPRRQDRRVVAQERVPRAQESGKLAEHPVRDRVGLAVDDEEARAVPALRRILRDQLGWEPVVESVGGDHGPRVSRAGRARAALGRLMTVADSAMAPGASAAEAVRNLKILDIFMGPCLRGRAGNRGSRASCFPAGSLVAN